MLETNQTSESSIYNSNWQLDFAIKLTEGVLAIFLNGFVLIVFLWMKKYTYSNVLFMLLCASHFIPDFIYFPLAFLSTFLVKWPLGDFVCVFYRIGINTQYLVSIYLLLVSSLHRFLQFVKPFDTQEKVTKKRTAVFIGCWAVPYAYMTVVHVIFVLTGRFNFQACVVMMPPLFVLLHDIFVVVLPTFFTITLNLFNIYRLYKKHEMNKTKFFGPVSRIEPQNTVTALSENQSASTGGRRKSVCRSAPHRQPHKRNLKAALCLLAVILNTFMSQYFYFILWPMFARCTACVGLELFNWSIRVALLCPILNPVIIIAFHQGFQKESAKLLRAIFKL